jgi:hypothetical protein
MTYHSKALFLLYHTNTHPHPHPPTHTHPHTDNAAYDMTVHAAIRYNQVTTTYPGVFYFSFVGTCARHRTPPEEEIRGLCVCVCVCICVCLCFSSLYTHPHPHTPTPTATATRLIKYLLYSLMGWHVRGVNFREHGIFDQVKNPGKRTQTQTHTHTHTKEGGEEVEAGEEEEEVRAREVKEGGGGEHTHTHRGKEQNRQK